jgi:hypothetical protein
LDSEKIPDIPDIPGLFNRLALVNLWYFAIRRFLVVIRLRVMDRCGLFVLSLLSSVIYWPEMILGSVFYDCDNRGKKFRQKKMMSFEVANVFH